MNRVKPLADVCAIYESEDSVLPDAVKLLMSDHTAYIYRLDHGEAAMQFRAKNIAILEKWRKEDEVVGYKYKAKHLNKKERRRERFSRAASRK